MRNLVVLILLLSTCKLYAQDVDQLIKRHIDAVGGEKNWDKIKTVKVEGVVEMEGVQIKTTKRIIKDKAWRNDMLFEGKTQSLKNNKFYVSILQDKGWKYLPDSKDDKPELLDKGEIALYKEEMEFEDPFIHYQSKGTKISYLNIENVLDVDYYKFAFTYASGKQEYIYVRAKDMMIAKRVVYNSDAEDTKDYDYYEKQSNGIYYPKLIRTNIGVIHIKTVQFNTTIEEKIFLPANG
ncbi:MAG: hypothetical protein JNM95_12655 [Chitinophagaceae bacterium]|nr:hypothetical protein [Chitinophagaceae bacterium]